MNFYPELPKPPGRIIPFLSEKPTKAEGGILWSYKSKTSPRDVKINKGCFDVSKTKVEEVFESVFGYSLSVDPLTHNGYCLEKSNMGHNRPISFVKCPAVQKDGMVYEKIIDARVSPTHIIEHRVFFFRGIDFVVGKLKSDMFGYKAEELYFYETSEVFDLFEELNIIRFCKEFGMDFGELDILRDTDGRIYIIDVNNIPGEGGVLNRLPKAKERYKKQIYALEKALEG